MKELSQLWPFAPFACISNRTELNPIHYGNSAIYQLCFYKDGNIYLSSLIEQNMGDCDGFGIEPDDYLVGEVAPDGTFIEPLHII